VQDTNPNAQDPITKAQATSATYTMQMHIEIRDRLIQQIRDSKHPRATDPNTLDLYETAIYHAAHSDDPIRALYLYDDQLGGYGHLGSRLGDYRRGLRITAFLMSVLGADYMDVLASPAHDHNLYLLALGQLALVEHQTRHLLDHAREIAQVPLDETADRWKNPLGYFRENSNIGYVMYEAVLLQTWSETLLAQGKLQAAEALMNEVLDQPREWAKFGRADKGRNGSNPYARRALARALMGDVEKAFEDFKAANTFAKTYTTFMLFPSHDWHHRTYYAAFLARLGYLTDAQNQLDSMNIERIRTYRPLTTAEFDLAAAEIAYARGNYVSAEEHANRVLEWSSSSGHLQIYVKAHLILAKLRLRADDFDQADELLKTLIDGATTAGFALQQTDGLILNGYLGLASNDLPRVKDAAVEAETSSQTVGYRWGIGDAAHLLARCAEMQGEAEEALRHAHRALSVREQIRDPKITYTQAVIDRSSSNVNPA
jgi:tetratricopeptide (TPR) repeat protein